MLEKLVRNFLYYPLTLEEDAPLPDYASDATQVWMNANDGNRIHGLYWPAQKQRPTILFFHGNAQSVFDWALIRPEFAQADCGLLLIDYPGYGKSSGTPNEDGLYAAGFAALQFLLDQNIPENKIIAFGKSLGGPVASKVAEKFSLMGLVLESTFTSIPSVAKLLLPMLPENPKLESENYDTASRLANIHTPVLVIHGTEDELIPIDEGRALFNLANEPKALYLVEGAGHNDVSLFAEEEYSRQIRQWLDTL